MKLDRQKLFSAISYINEVNNSDFLEMDFSDLFDDKKDLTEEEKTALFWVNERLSNIDIIKKVLKEKKLQSEKEN